MIRLIWKKLKFFINCITELKRLGIGEYSKHMNAMNTF